MKAIFIIATAIIFLLSGCTVQSSNKTGGTALNKDDEAAILALFKSYIQAVKTGDRAALTAVFHPTAMMYGYYKQYDNNIPIAAFIDIQMKKGPAPDVVTELSNLEITGRIASLKVVSKNWNGDSYTDYYTCIKTVKDAVGAKYDNHPAGISEAWLIASKTFFLHE